MQKKRREGGVEGRRRTFLTAPLGEFGAEPPPLLGPGSSAIVRGAAALAEAANQERMSERRAVLRRGESESKLSKFKTGSAFGRTTGECSSSEATAEVELLLLVMED